MLNFQESILVAKAVFFVITHPVNIIDDCSFCTLLYPDANCCTIFCNTLNGKEGARLFVTITLIEKNDPLFE